MDNISRVNTAIEFIEQNLDEDFELSAVSNAAGMSQWHFQRIFHALTGETLKGYIRARRLSSAMKSLLRSDRRIIEIAMEAGYESQESFTRAFHSLFSKTPGEFRKEQNPHLFMEKLKIDRDYLDHIAKGVSKEPEILVIPETKYVGLRTLLYGVESEKNNMGEKLGSLWREFMPRKSEIKNRVGETGFGLIRQSTEPQGQLEYFSVEPVTSVPSHLPDSMVSVIIPEQKVARFIHKGRFADFNHTINYIYSAWLLNSDYVHSSGFDIESYGAKFHPTSSECEISCSVPIR